MLSLWNLYPLLLDFVVKVKVKAARLNATVVVVVEEKQQLGQDPTFSHLGLERVGALQISSDRLNYRKIPKGIRRQQALWKLVSSVDPSAKAESMGQLSGK